MGCISNKTVKHVVVVENIEQGLTPTNNKTKGPVFTFEVDNKQKSN